MRDKILFVIGLFGFCSVALAGNSYLDTTVNQPTFYASATALGYGLDLFPKSLLVPPFTCTVDKTTYCTNSADVGAGGDTVGRWILSNDTTTQLPAGTYDLVGEAGFHCNAGDSLATCSAISGNITQEFTISTSGGSSTTSSCYSNCIMSTTTDAIIGHTFGLLYMFIILLIVVTVAWFSYKIIK